jgi:uncharacterized protein (TIGR02186 family)
MKIGYFILFAAFCLFTVSAGAAQDSARMTIEPRAIDIGALYNGTTLTATGSVPADSEAVVRFIGTSCDLHMKEKGKVGGVMWMNLESITFKGVPNICLVSSAVDLNRLEADGGVTLGVLRLSGLKKSIEIEAKGGGHENAFEELLKLKQKEGLYREMFGNISYASAVDGQKTFSAKIPIPSRLIPGAYTVEVDAIRNGEVIARAEQPLTVNLVGFPALLAQLAFGHSALYGILATLIALLAGLGIGLIFQSRGAH